jgi:hypothetical protein
MLNRTVRALLGVVVLPLIASLVKAADPTTMTLGLHGADPDLSTWEQILNRPAGSMYVNDFVADKGSWDDYAGSAWSAATRAPQGRRLVLAVGFFPDGCECTIQQAAAGAYHSYYRNVAAQLIAYGHTDAIIRVAWEFDGDWYPWGYGQSGLTEAEYDTYYRQAFRHLVRTFRKELGNSFTFVWNPDVDAASRLPSYRGTYPGNAYVDCVGPDVYDNKWDATADPASRWANEDSTLFSQIAQMSSTKGKPICFPEWAAGEGGDQVGLEWPNDNSTFVTNMANFLADPTMGGMWPGATVWFHSYWSGDQNSGYTGWINTPDYYPNQRAVYIARFGAPAPP